MRTAWSLGLSAALLSQTFFAISAKAASFPDVPASSPYKTAINALADQKIINGNPDGTFAPDRTVNRAEFLTLLYRAKSMTTSAPSAACFKDVPVSAWFAGVICDAAAKTFVSGYGDKTFKPEQAVNRVEALKMMFTVFGLSQQTSAEASAKVTLYTDVSSSAWYMQYLLAAFKLNILPVPGVSSTTFGPDRPLSRAEAAAYIYNAISPSPLALDGSVSSSSVATQQSSAATNPDASSAQSRSSKSQVTLAQPVITQVDFPFNDNGNLGNKNTHSYRFSVKEKTTAKFQVTVAGQQTPDDVTCRLFKLNGESFSLEYYLGYQSADSCAVLATLAVGSYQLDVQGRVANLDFTLTSKKITGDGNDGFTQAKSLITNAPVSSFIDANDPGDFYTFSLKEQTNMMIELTNADNLKCVIYPMENVDIYGFAQPNCNTQYDFPAGTYYIGVLLKDNHTSKESYSIRTKK